MLCKKLEDIWEAVRDVCAEMHKQLEWQGQEEPWNSPKWRQKSLQGAIVANVDEAYEVATAALQVFGKVLKEVSLRFRSFAHGSLWWCEDDGLKMWEYDSASAYRCETANVLHLEQSSTSLGQSLSRAALRVEVTTAVVRCHPQVALKAGIEAGDTFLLGGDKVASVCVAPLKGRDRAVEKAGNMPIGPDKDRTEGPAIAWVHRFDYNVADVAHSRLRLAAVH